MPDGPIHLISDSDGSEGPRMGGGSAWICVSCGSRSAERLGLGQVAGEGSPKEDFRGVTRAHDPLPWRGLRGVGEDDRPLDMPPYRFPFAVRILTFLAGVLILKTVVSVASKYYNYFPPDFASDFLRGREGHFWGAYSWAFYTHIVSGPVTLVLGLFLVSPISRSRVPTWHRRLGRVQVACVLLLVAPSGLWMAYYAAAGPIAAVGLATLAIATASCALLGVRAALGGRFADHRRWMWRCYLLLCSAVMIRLIGGLATVTGMTAPWVDPVATWMCWLAPWRCSNGGRGGQGEGKVEGRLPGIIH